MRPRSAELRAPLLLRERLDRPTSGSPASSSTSSSWLKSCTGKRAWRMSGTPRWLFTSSTV